MERGTVNGALGRGKWVEDGRPCGGVGALLRPTPARRTDLPPSLTHRFHVERRTANGEPGRGGGGERGRAALRSTCSDPPADFRRAHRRPCSQDGWVPRGTLERETSPGRCDETRTRGAAVDCSATPTDSGGAHRCPPCRVDGFRVARGSASGRRDATWPKDDGRAMDLERASLRLQRGAPTSLPDEWVPRGTPRRDVAQGRWPRNGVGALLPPTPAGRTDLPAGRVGSTWNAGPRRTARKRGGPRTRDRAVEVGRSSPRLQRGAPTSLLAGGGASGTPANRGGSPGFESGPGRAPHSPTASAQGVGAARTGSTWNPGGLSVRFSRTTLRNRRAPP